MPFLKRRISPNILKKQCPPKDLVCRILRRLHLVQVLWMSLMIGVGIGLFVQTATANPETESDVEYRIKAAFLLNFCKFVSWPDGLLNKADAPLIICVLGKDSFKVCSETLAMKSVWGHPLEIRFASNAEAIGTCHLLYIPETERKESADSIARVKNKPILTVGDWEAFAYEGGMIAFVKIDGKIRFEINRQTAEAAGIKISSQLLNLAIISNEAHAKEN